MTLLFENETESDLPFDPEKTARRVIGEALTHEGCPYECEVSLTLTDENGIRDLNSRFRAIDSVTDVLSFPLVPFETPSAFDALDDMEDCFDPDTGDLMLGSVGEDSESIKRSVDALCALPLNHISAYMLKIEEGTAFDCDEVRNKVADDDKMCDLYLTAAEELEAHGFMQYEISNFAKEGFQSRHNNKYWECEEYLGFGPSAHSFYGGKRYCCPSDVKRFIESEIQPEIITEESVDSGEEYILLGLRLSKGISLDRVTQLYSPEAAESLLKRAKLFESHGLAEVGEDRVKLTRKGYLVSNGIIAELIDAVNS